MARDCGVAAAKLLELVRVAADEEEGRSKDWAVHQAMSFFTLYSMNFCWAVRTLREEIIPKKQYRQRPPAMVAGLSDHVWTLTEWLSFPGTKRYKLTPFSRR